MRSNLYLTEVRRGTEIKIMFIRVYSTEVNMPGHGELRAETEIFFDMRTGGQQLIAQSVSRLCGLNAEHSSLCGN